MKLPGEITVPGRINGIDSKSVRVAPSTAAHRRMGEQPSQAPAADPVDVQLSGRAQQLAEIETALRAMPAVDEFRVSVVKQRLNGGDYQVDAQKVADKLLHLEGELSRGNPLEHAGVK